MLARQTEGHYLRHPRSPSLGLEKSMYRREPKMSSNQFPSSYAKFFMPSFDGDVPSMRMRRVGTGICSYINT